MAAEVLLRSPLRPRAAAPGARVYRSGAEAGRRTVVRLVFVVYLLLIFEGSIRKWLLPEFSQYVFFVRDPFLLAAYVVATRHGLWPRGQPWFLATLALAGLGLLLVAVQFVVGGPSETRALLAVHGFRSYFLYVPLAFVVGATFRPEDLRRFWRLTLWLAAPVAVLVAVQFFAPPGAPINVGIAADEALQFRGLTATAERTRPMGPFSSGAGQQQFVATVWTVALALFIAAPARRGVPLGLVLLGGAGAMVCAGFSGSRGTVLQCGVAVVFALIVALIGRGSRVKLRAVVWTSVLIALALALYPLLLPEGYATFVERWTVADRIESRGFTGGVFGRALYSQIDFVRLLDSVPLLGYGLGYGTNASITLRATVDGVMPGKLVETDFARHMVDLGPVFGVAYIAFRLGLVTWLAARALRVTRLVADPMPMLLLSYVALIVGSGQITGQGAINGYGWLFAGLLIAASRHAGMPASPRAQQLSRHSVATRAPSEQR